MGLLQPSDGSISVDGIDINSSNVSLWHRNISHVPQDIYLSDTSLASNIAFGISEEDIDKKLLHDVVKQSKLVDFLKKLPEKFNTIVGERGVRLSGG